MAEFVISPYAVSFESIKNSLQNYVLNKPENERWLDFYASAAGETILEIAAALGAFYAYHTIMGRRESYLPLAENYTSIVGLAENNGYSCSRGSNLQVRVNIVPNQTLTLPKWTVIGSYAEYDVVLLKDTILNSNVATDVDIIIGNLLEENLQVTTNKLSQFSFYNANTTEDFRLLLNDVEVPTSTEIKDLLKDKYCTLTNVHGAYDVFYLQAGDYKYSSGDTLTSQFIERNNLVYSSFSPVNLTIDFASQVNEAILLQEAREVEEASQIKLKAPLYHETSMVIRSRKDYVKYLLTANPELIAANDRDINPGLIELTYLKFNHSVMTDEEKETWLDNIEEARPSGVARAYITEPVSVNKNLNIHLWKANGKDIPATISTDIDKILSEYNNKFGIRLDLNQLEHDIEQLGGIKIARVELDELTWEPNTPFKTTDILFKNNNTFYVVDFLHKSGNTEPSWPQEIGGTVVDNELVWERVEDYEALTLHTWNRNTNYNQYDCIRKDVLSDGTYAKTGTVEPTWGSETVYDNHIVWELTNDTGDERWMPNRIYYLDDVIKVVVIETVENEPQQVTYYYKCSRCFKYEEAEIYMVQNYVAKSSNDAVIWGDDIVYDNKIVWTKIESSDSYKEWAMNTPFEIGDTIKVTGFSGGANAEATDYFYVASSFIGLSGNEEPDWTNVDRNRIYDGDIVWSVMDGVQRSFELPWNNYLQLTKTYDIVG